MLTNDCLKDTIKKNKAYNFSFTIITQVYDISSPYSFIYQNKITQFGRDRLGSNGQQEMLMVTIKTGIEHDCKNKRIMHWWHLPAQTGQTTSADQNRLLRMIGLTHCNLATPYIPRPGSTLAQVMACCLMAPSHYLNRCWLIISVLHKKM